jgi:sugar (pentulose or hexulose) kinase
VYSLLGFGAGSEADIGAAVRSILEGMAFSYREAITDLEEVLGRSFDAIRIVGGGARNSLLCSMTADATDKRVFAGPVEAAVEGNFSLQCLATGSVASVDQYWEQLYDHNDETVFTPRNPHIWNKEYMNRNNRINNV